jgi:ribosomal protein S18 acetylase RimI-like enzyme
VITIRRLDGDDWRDWRALRLRALAEDPGAFGSVLADWTGERDTEERWRGRLGDLQHAALVLQDGRTVGMVGALAEAGGLDLVSLWVAPEARGAGVGAAAVGWVLRQAGTAPVELSVRIGNTAAVRLYERLGFEDAGPSLDDPCERRMRRVATGALEVRR